MSFSRIFLGLAMATVVMGVADAAHADPPATPKVPVAPPAAKLPRAPAAPAAPTPPRNAAERRSLDKAMLEAMIHAVNVSRASDTSPQSTRAAQGAENAWTKVAAFYRAKAAGAGVDDAQRTTALARAAWADGQADIFTKRLALVIGDPPANAPRTEANAGATTATPRAAQ